MNGDTYEDGVTITELGIVKYIRQKARMWAVLRSVEATLSARALNEVADEIEAGKHLAKDENK